MRVSDRRCRSRWILWLAAVGCSGGGGGGGGPDGAGGPPDAAVDAGEKVCDLPALGPGVATLTGCAQAGAADGPRGHALFANPVNVAVAPDGRIFAADFDNSRIRVILADGATSTLATPAGFSRVFGLAFASDGTLYAQTDDNAVGEHSTTTGTIWRIDTRTGDGPVIAHDLGRPRGMVVLADGRIVTSDYMHHVVRVLDPATGQVTPLAGALDQPGFADATGAAARFSQPYGVVDLGDGSVAVADYGNNRIRRVTLAGQVTTLAGTGDPGHADGAAATATFRAPQDLAIDADGTIFVADAGNFVIRRLGAGIVDTVAGNGAAAYLDAVDPLAASIYGLEGLDLAPDGTLYIADGNRGEELLPHNRIRRAVLGL